MKECWINVYESPHGRWLGNAWPSKYLAEVRQSKNTIYRIHVKLK